MGQDTVINGTGHCNKWDTVFNGGSNKRDILSYFLKIRT